MDLVEEGSILVIAGLGVRAPHVIFGHTHRAGMLEGDEAAEWLTPNGVRLHNTGSWVFSRAFSRGPAIVTHAQPSRFSPQYWSPT